eukprot:TRINITY_DN17754_c0_g1_i1.p2 TRINITY_DN17754_c0_g1~~TRINITY_DN17754_c0_g1_i1.p2  ORF type:complete len:103 (-),score=19.48 TRINITY_DN17754_c0_g1_i1:138-446(-)
MMGHDEENPGTMERFGVEEMKPELTKETLLPLGGCLIVVGVLAVLIVCIIVIPIAIVFGRGLDDLSNSWSEPWDTSAVLSSGSARWWERAAQQAVPAVLGRR